MGYRWDQQGRKHDKIRPHLSHRLLYLCQLKGCTVPIHQRKSRSPGGLLLLLRVYPAPRRQNYPAAVFTSSNGWHSPGTPPRSCVLQYPGSRYSRGDWFAGHGFRCINHQDYIQRCCLANGAGCDGGAIKTDDR